MPTLLLSPRYTADSRQLRRAAESAGWQVFRQADWRPPRREFTGDLALYGEPLFVDVMAAALDLTLIDSPPDWLTRVPARFTQRVITAMTLGEAYTLAQPRFVKPAREKSFPAGVYTMATQAPEACKSLPGDLHVLVSEPVRWEIEFRGFVLHRQLLALSPYLRDGQLVEDAGGNWIAGDEEWQAARNYYAQILADPELDLAPAIVLDVGLIAGRGWAVIETNGAWGAGLYGCDPAAVLPAVQHATRFTATMSPADQRWAREHVEVEA
jgi:hypothetical protein